VIVHCTITAQMMKAPDYLEAFLRFWSPRPEIRKVWMSIFTSQRGAHPPECLSPEERARTIADLLRLRDAYPKLDMARGAIREFAQPPQSSGGQQRAPAIQKRMGGFVSVGSTFSTWMVCSHPSPKS
jgi:hypothetical protein